MDINDDIFNARYSAFNPYRLRQSEMGYGAPVGYGDAMAKSLYCGMKPIASWTYDTTKSLPTGGVFNLEFSPEGSLLVAACEKKSIQIFDPLTHQRIHSVYGAHLDCVNCVKFLDGRMFATCSDDTTIALWDIRNLNKKIRSLHGHSKWVKNIEFSTKDKLLVTSGLDGSIYTWDINSYTECNLVYQRVFNTSSLMRCRLSPDAKQMVMCTTGGLLVIIHDLNLNTLTKDLHGFKPNLYRLMQMSQQLIPVAAMYDHLFDSSRKENRVEFVADFPEGNDAEVVSALQIHPQGWSALSRNISHDDKSEWTCIHDIQPCDEPRTKSTRDTGCSPVHSPTPPAEPAPAAPPPRRVMPPRAVRRLRPRPYTRHPLPQVHVTPAEQQRAAPASSRREEAATSRSAESVPGPSTRATAPQPSPASPTLTSAVHPLATLRRPNTTRIGRGIQNDVWEAAITIKQHRVLQEIYNRGQVRRNFNMQRITGINTGITPPPDRPIVICDHSPSRGQVRRNFNMQRITGINTGITPPPDRPIVICDHSPSRPSTSGQTPRDIVISEEARAATKHYIRQNRDRLLYYIEETNKGKGFIKELCYSADGRVVCSPFGRGMRLLALNDNCSELSHCVQDLTSPRPMVEVGQSLGIHQDLVVSSKFSPRYHMLVTGCLEGKIVWYQPFSGETLY